MQDVPPSDGCHCKEEVEMEEAQALVAAMEQSEMTQLPLPFVPGLSRPYGEKTVTIRVQDEAEVRHELKMENKVPTHSENWESQGILKILWKVRVKSTCKAQFGHFILFRNITSFLSHYQSLCWYAMSDAGLISY